jgi:exopolyphosphatase/guanosine-5'-triphosphate,3'-diphosphate pyrophosphatase
MEISILDVGAASLNLLSARFSRGELTERTEHERFVRLGEGTLLSGAIAPDAWNSALSGIEALLACAKSTKPEEIIAVATSVMREAVNGPAFCKTLHVLYGLRVRVLSPAEEATLCFRGAQSALDRSIKRLLAIDLGGGCVNFALGQDSARCPLTATLPLGTMRLRPAFAPDGLLSRADAGALSALVHRSIASSNLHCGDRSSLAVVICSRAARAVRKHAMRGSAQSGATGALSRSAVAAAQRELISVPAAELEASGVLPDDAPSLALATTVVRAIMDALPTDEVLVVDRGLREGVALDHCQRARARAIQRPALAD